MPKAVGSRWNRQALKDRYNFHKPDDKKKRTFQI